MRINKFISYILCNKGIIINLHKLHFPSFPFFSPTKQKSFLSSHFSTLPTKHIRGKTTIFFILSFFHPPTFPLLHPNGVFMIDVNVNIHTKISDEKTNFYMSGLSQCYSCYHPSSPTNRGEATLYVGGKRGFF